MPRSVYSQTRATVTPNEGVLNDDDGDDEDDNDDDDDD